MDEQAIPTYASYSRWLHHFCVELGWLYTLVWRPTSCLLMSMDGLKTRIQTRT